MGDIGDREVVSGIWELFKHNQNTEFEQQRLEQERKAAEEFTKSQDKQAILFREQLQILERETALQEKQTLLLERTYRIYIALAVIAGLNLLLFGMQFWIALKTP
jgi:hypothetical protein